MSKKTKADLTLMQLIEEFENSSKVIKPILWEDKHIQKLIHHFERQRNYDKAIEVIDMALHTYLYKTEYYLWKAKILITLRRSEEALVVLNKAKELSPNDPNILLQKAKAYATLKDFHNANILLKEARKQTAKADEMEVLLVEAFIQECMKDYDQMFFTLRDALRVNPNNPEALEQIWISVEVSKKYHESIELHRSIIDKNPYSYLAWYNLGHAYTCIGMYEEALEALDYSYIINPHYEQACLDCADLALQLNRIEEALHYFSEACERFGEDVDMVVNLADCLIRLNRYKEAKVKLHKVAEQDPYNDEIFFLLGESYSGEYNWPKAIKYYLEAIEIDNEREEFHFSIAKAYEAKELFKKAETHFRKAALYGHEQSKYWASYIAFLIRHKFFEKAQKAISKADRVSCGADILYTKAAFAYFIESKKESLIILEEALSEDVSLKHIFEDLIPEFAGTKDYQAMVKYFGNLS
ncbi:MAG TPA: tetratricopeptide repeat protein [Saprospiraceae bacterium]|nr:tetratricopeptide repeat protein [Saprospiraceae bacterium]